MLESRFKKHMNSILIYDTIKKVMLNFRVRNYFEQAFSVKLTLIFFHECVHSIIPHQHMQKLCILMQNCDFESTLNAEKC